MLARCGTYVHVAPFYYYVHHSITLVASIFIIFEHRYLPEFVSSSVHPPSSAGATNE